MKKSILKILAILIIIIIVFGGLYLLEKSSCNVWDDMGLKTEHKYTCYIFTKEGGRLSIHGLSLIDYYKYDLEDKLMKK